MSSWFLRTSAGRGEGPHPRRPSTPADHRRARHLQRAADDVGTLVPAGDVTDGEILREPDLTGGVVNHHAADMVTARALRHGLDTGPWSDAVVRELVELAGADRRSLELALARVERGLADRSSRVGERAREALERALACVAARHASSPLPTTGPDVPAALRVEQAEATGWPG